jgi:uncharacterized protein YndB with AHSA1/START domain
MTDTVAPVTVSAAVGVGPVRAFQLFTEHFDAWWPRGHHIGAADLQRGVIEPFVGGRWYEVGVDGSTCEWGRVLVWEPPARLVLSWHLDGTWSYNPDPKRASEVEVRFEPLPDGSTTVTLEHRGLERMVGAAGARGALGSEGGWPGIVAGFARLASVATH